MINAKETATRGAGTHGWVRALAVYVIRPFEISLYKNKKTKIKTREIARGKLCSTYNFIPDQTIKYEGKVKTFLGMPEPKICASLHPL